MTDGQTVLVLGAGASVAEAQWHRPKQDSEYPPLDATFFRRAQRRAQPARLTAVERHAAKLGQTDLCSGNPPVSLEQYLGRLFFEMTTTTTPPNIQAYYDLVRWYSVELRTTTNWMMKRPGTLKKVLERELRRNARLSVVTFNHDLLAENALSLLAPRLFGHAWCIRHAYAFADEPGRIADRSASFDWDCPGGTDAHVPIYKLHGSLNWVLRTRDRDPPPDFGRKRDKSRSLQAWNNVELNPSVERVKAAGSRGRTSWYLWPLVIPPIYEKHGLIHGELAHVWGRAADALREASRVIFWGYSFPRADLHARYFFQGAANENDALRTPIVINPDPEVQINLWGVLKPKRVAQYHDVLDFLEDDA